MVKDRIADPTQWVAGTVMGAAGKFLSDQKKQFDRKIDQAAGGKRNAVGGLKDTVRETTGKS